jgi:hypothetical protein
MRGKGKKPVILNPYKFMVLTKKNKWEEWSGYFETKEIAMSWFNKHGQFHLDRGHTLGLFYRNKLLKTYKPNESSD